MASNRSGSKGRTRLTKAEIKAYESRRAAERRRLAIRQQESDAEQVERDESTGYTMTRNDEFGVIKSDLVRLGWIVLALGVLLASATVLLS